MFHVLQGRGKFPTGGKARELRKQLIWCKSKADSIVWMEEERAESDYLFALPLALVFLTPGLF